MNESRLRLLHLSEYELLKLLSGEIMIDKLDLPSDARVVGVHYDFARAGIAIRIHSADFDPVPEGQLIPYLSGCAWLLLNRQR